MENVARVRDAFNRREQGRQTLENLGQLNAASSRKAENQRIDGKTVPEPFKFKQSATFIAQRERRL